MTLLERWDIDTVGTIVKYADEIRRALAIAQAVEEMNDMTASHGWVVDDIMRRADELEGKK